MDIKTQALEKGLDFSPVQRSFNGPELRKDFEEFARKMRIKRNFRNEPSGVFSDKPAFHPKSSWKPPPGHPGLELFLSQIKKDTFENLVKDSTPINSNMTKEEWDVLRRLTDDKSIVIKKADKGSCAVVWCRDDYIKKVENQLNDNTVYKDVNFKETILSD